jgi:hypothetical protein
MFKTRLRCSVLAMAFVGLSTGCEQASTTAGENTSIDDGAVPIDGGDMSKDGGAAPIDGGGTPLDGGVVPIDGGNTVSEDAQTDAGIGGAGDGLYQPNNGPTHESGSMVAVCSETEILAAISNASPGDVITVCPGSFDFNERISVQNDGQASGRIFLRADTLGTVIFNLSHIENFKVSGKFWIFENLEIQGACTSGNGCEHAFHIVGDADDLIFRNNEVVNFASHIKLNAEVVAGGTVKSFPDRAMFIQNFWHNTRYVQNNAPHNILNLDGGKDHVVRGNIFADYNTPASLSKSASAVYPKASTLRILIEQNLIVCEKVRTDGETARGIELGDGAPASICDGDVDLDGAGDCSENGQNQEGVIRNNIIMNCNNGGSASGIMVGSDRASKIYHNTVINTGQRNAAFYVGHEAHDTYWRNNILERGFNVNYANRALNESDNIQPSASERDDLFSAPSSGDLSLAEGDTVIEQILTDTAVAHDFCGYPRGETADLGAIEYSTQHAGVPCAEIVKQRFDRIP